MEKSIKVIMCENKSIRIEINSEVKHVIEPDARNISAGRIYELLDFHVGDEYSVSSEKETDVDEQVLQFFVELLTNIVEKINNIQVESIVG